MQLNPLASGCLGRVHGSLAGLAQPFDRFRCRGNDAKRKTLTWHSHGRDFLRRGFQQIFVTYNIIRGGIQEFWFGEDEAIGRFIWYHGSICGNYFIYHLVENFPCLVIRLVTILLSDLSA